jgi:hypothetical protein
MVIAGLQSSSGDAMRAKQAIAPLATDSPVLFTMCGSMLDAGDANGAMQLLAQTPTRISGGFLALLIVGPIVFAMLLTGAILFAVLGR